MQAWVTVFIAGTAALLATPEARVKDGRMIYLQACARRRIAVRSGDAGGGSAIARGARGMLAGTGVFGRIARSAVGRAEMNE